MCHVHSAKQDCTRADISIPECAESKECHPAKHHYDECVERVTGQIENDGKASEDCVEECMFTRIGYITSVTNSIQSSISLIARLNAPRPSSSLSSSSHLDLHPTPITTQLDAGRRFWYGGIRHDISRMTVNIKVMFRLSVLFPHAKPHLRMHMFCVKT